MAIHSTKGRNTIRDGIANRTPFRHASMSGTQYGNGAEVSDIGQLPSQHRTALETVTEPVYVVRSYATPIGWYANGTWTVPDVKYSPTTTQHQGMLRVAAGA